MISEKQLNEWQRLADAATQAKWVVNPYPKKEGHREVVTEHTTRYGVYETDKPIARILTDSRTADKNDANAKFIAAARAAVPALLAEVRLLKEMLGVAINNPQLLRQLERLVQESNRDNDD